MCAERGGKGASGAQYDVLLWVVTAQGLRVMALSLCREENLAVIEHVLNSLGEVWQVYKCTSVQVCASVKRDPCIWHKEAY